MPIVPKPVPFDQALRLVAGAGPAQCDPPVLENLELLDTSGRVLAAPILADRDQPPFNRSTRDGFAVISSALSPTSSLTIIGQLRAGQQWQGPSVSPATAIEIMTGAPLPAGADCVVMVEHVVRSGNTVRIATGRIVTPGDNVVRKGVEARERQEMIPARTRIAAAEIALAASCGYTRLPVFPRPKVAIIATGDELVDLGETLAPWKIRNSNTYGLAAMVSACGGHPVPLAIARDTRESLRERLASGRMYDLLLLSGGVSMGAYDLVEEVLAEHHAEFFFTGVQMQPGKPVVFGRLPASDRQPPCCFFGLPGNPVSTQVTFHCFVEPLLRALAGESHPAPRWAMAFLAEEVNARNLTRLLPARLHDTRVALIPWQGSGDLAANARANCYVELRPDTSYKAGEVVRILLR